jgi:glycosyltransferase involved in cell wall biosynthesis
MERQLTSLGAPPEKIHRIVYGVDADLFCDAKPAEAEAHFLAVGRFVEKKAPLLTLLAFARVRRACPRARLTMIGDGPLHGACLALAYGLRIDDAVAFPGVLDQEGVAEMMKTARAFVQHSLRAADGDSEGTPVAVLEAQAAGLPVVATQHAGIQDVVVEAQTGHLVPERDVEGMAEAMLALARDPARAAAMGQAGRQRVLDHFTRDKSIGRLAGILEELGVGS